MDISKAYRKCALAWGADKLPSLDSIKIEYRQDLKTTSYAACAVWDSEYRAGEPTGIVLIINKRWFHFLWLALCEKLSAPEANRVFDEIVEKTLVHELAHIAGAWYVEYRGWPWHGAWFKWLMHQAGYPKSSRFLEGDGRETEIWHTPVRYRRVHVLAGEIEDDRYPSGRMKSVVSRR